MPRILLIHAYGFGSVMVGAGATGRRDCVGW